MISYEEAYKKVISSTGFELKIEEVSIFDAVGRILAENAVADIEMPPFNKSAMDGYACRLEDIANELLLLEVISAGKVPTKKIEKNQCSKIMTGAMLPEGANCVIIVEEVERISENKIKFLGNSTRANFVQKANDVKIGDVLIQKNTFLKPQHIAILASIGYAKVKVFSALKVGIISTGDELVEPYETPKVSEIRNSNAYQLYAQIKQVGAEPIYVGIAKDNFEQTKQIISQAFDKCDMILISGGVSMGDFDFVPKVLEEIGVKTIFYKIAIQPGKPTMFGQKDNKFCFGLPGNPVSSFVIFELFTKPLIYKMMGFDFQASKIMLPMGVDYSRKQAERLSFIPIKINENGEIIPLNYHGSAHVHALHLADGLIAIPIGKTQILKGEKFDVRQI